MKRNEVVRKMVAVMVAIFGCCVIGAVVHSLGYIFDGKGFLSHIFVIVFWVIPLSLFGGYCLFVARKVWVDISVETVKRISFFAAFLIFFVIAGAIGSIFKCETLAHCGMWLQIINLFSVSVAGGFYLLVNRLLMRWLDLKEVIDWRRREKTVRRFFMLVAFFTFGACMSIIKSLDPSVSGDADARHVIWLPFVGLILPAIIAFLVYRIYVRVALRKRPTVVDGGVGESVQGVVNNSTS